MILRPSDLESMKKLNESENTKSVVPLDGYLGIDKLPFKISVPMMLRTAFWAQNQCSYQRAENILRDECGVFINDDTVRLITNHIGALVFTEDHRKALKCYDMFLSGKLPYTRDQKGVLYIQTDGAALNTRLKDAGNSTWRENKLGLVFSTDYIHFWTDKKGERQHRILKKEYTSLLGNVDTFKLFLLSCAVRNGYGEYKKTIILSDGATWIRNMAEEIFPDAQHILDFFHLSENVYEFAKFIFSMDKTRYEPWAKDITKALRNSDYPLVLHELAQFKDRELPSGVVNLHGYISNNIHNIDYKTYIEQGYFIGSGAIESANKTVLQQRLKQAGMRWNVASAQNILTLRAKYESNLWECDVNQFILDHYAQYR
jgi:hypothetical protein